MWTYRARITDVISSRVVVVEVDLGFHVRTEVRVTLTDVPAVHSAGAARAAAQAEAWLKERADGSQWPFVITLERIAYHDEWGTDEHYIGTITTPNGDSLGEHMIRWADDNPF